MKERIIAYNKALKSQIKCLFAVAIFTMLLLVLSKQNYVSGGLAVILMFVGALIVFIRGLYIDKKFKDVAFFITKVKETLGEQ